MQESRPFIDINNVVFSHGERTVWEGISLAIPKGQITAIMGPSGTGKTTLLKLIGGELSPDAGDIWVDEYNVPTLDSHTLFKLRQQMGVLFQSGALFTDLSVFDNVAFPLREHTELHESLIYDLVLMKLQAVGLRGAKDLMPRELSGGMARRVALARAIALDPTLMMYDEPFTGQDPISMGVLVKLIKTLNDTLGLTSIVVSHDVQEAASIADYIYVLANGQVLAEGTPETLKHSDSLHVEQFMCGLADGPVPFHFPATPLAQEILATKEEAPK